jgi:hypothetical protein
MDAVALVSSCVEQSMNTATVILPAVSMNPNCLGALIAEVRLAPSARKWRKLGGDGYVFAGYLATPTVHLGLPGGNAHGADEWVDIPSLVALAKILLLPAVCWTAKPWTRRDASLRFELGPCSSPAPPNAIRNVPMLERCIFWPALSYRMRPSIEMFSPGPDSEAQSLVQDPHFMATDSCVSPFRSDG